VQIWTMNEQDCYDAGFANGKDFWVAEEQERIIKLLDDWKCGHPNCDGDRTEVCYPKHYLIQLIKRETK